MGFPFFCLLFVLARPFGLRIRSTPGTSSECNFVQMTFGSRDFADSVVRSLLDGQKPEASFMDIASPNKWRTSTIVGTLTWVVLGGVAVVTAGLVQACMNRGCCADDAATLDMCVTTGYSN